MAGQTFAGVWESAQREVEVLGVEGDPFSIQLREFSVVALEELPTFLSDIASTTCSKHRTSGCFAIVRLVSETGTRERGYLIFQRLAKGNRAERERVLRHEACHAILWKLGDSRWDRYGRGHEIPPVEVDP